MRMTAKSSSRTRRQGLDARAGPDEVLAQAAEGRLQGEEVVGRVVDQQDVGPGLLGAGGAPGGGEYGGTGVIPRR